ncbi:MAG: phosphocholine cytidylyltransferase family protein [Gammaproteobacteria bacterium]|nr:phosphocholine cytidylyltransferase family protein [Gammaproteobacteria bacterium]
MDDFNARSHVFKSTVVNDALAPQALILAAGRGKRLGPHIEDFPKCLLQVGGRSLLDHQLSMLAAAGIRDVCVVTGYQHHAVERVCRGRAHTLHSPRWAETNSLYSFWLARAWVNRRLVVMNCDVLADQRILSRLLDVSASSFVFDSNSGEDDEHMKVEIAGNSLRSMGKTLKASSVHGENVGLLQFSASDVQCLFVHAGSILQNGGENRWLATAVQTLARDHDVRAVDIRGLPWIEIDYQEDLDDARRRVWPSIEPANRPGKRPPDRRNSPF